MDAKDLRTEPALSERNHDSGKYSQSSGIALHCDRNKSYQEIGSNSLPKVEIQGTRPCAVIGPDRVVPPTASNESYIKKGPSEPWPCMDNSYHMRRPPEYPHKLANFQNSTRNISPRQTFQENMQRIMVPPSYNSVKLCEDNNYTQLSERNNVLPKNIKINVPSEAKFCDVPYTVFPPNNEQKNIRNPDMCLPNMNSDLTRTAPHGWPGSVNVRPSRTYGAPDLYQYQDYSNCAGPRPVMSRPNRTGPEDPGYVYADPFYQQEGNIRFKPYPTVKERFPQQRYDYVNNYANSFHPQPTFQSHKYELQKPVPPHPYSPYPPIKYVDRASEPTIDSYQRNQQGTYNIAYRHQLINPNFGPVLGTCTQNKIHSYPPEGHVKQLGPNKIPYENAKGYIEFENGRPKMYPHSEGYLINEMGRMHPMKSQVIMPNYPSLNMHGLPANPYYKKDSQPIKNYEYIQAHYRTMDPNMNMRNPMARHPQVFSPNTLAISPTDSSASNDTSQALGTPQEDCGYASQSSTASVRSIDSGMNRMPNEYIRKYYDSRFGSIHRTSAMMSKSELTASNASKEKKNIDVRQFLQMWNEGDEETEENVPKGITQAGSKTENNFGKTHEVYSQANQEQLYVLGLVNVSSEELGKYEHIQKVSKLPENIKGYNHLELLNQFEEAIESSNITNYKTSKDFQMAPKVTPLNKGTCAIPPRPLSPLDVESKISQSVIHKEVGCNFEIKPCSPKMMNVEVATPVQNILLERVIEKVANPVMLKSPQLNDIDESIGCNIIKKDHRLNMNDEANRIPSCKMVNTFSNNNSIDTIKNSYSLQDLESNSGLCLASLPRLDNDIELNFPEVNQQFINANKRDSSCLTASPRDLPTLEVLEQNNQSKDKLKDSNSLTHEADNLKSPCVPDSEKECSKLSKYRKTRTHLTIPKENIHSVRTDSVIIKNPDNVKNYEERSALSPNPVIKQVIDIQQAPINLTSQGNIVDNQNNISLLPSQNEINKETDTSMGIAIDFSLKNITNDDAESMDINIDKNAENLSQNTCETNNLILDQQINKPSRNADTHESDSNSHDKENENYTNSEVYSNTPTAKEINSVDTPIEEAFINNEYVSATSNGAKEEYMSPVSLAKDVNDDNSSSIIPMDFDTPPVELLRTTDGSSSDYLMDIDKDIENSMRILENTNKSQISSTMAAIEDLKTGNKHGPSIFDISPGDTTIMEGTVEPQPKLNDSKYNELSRLLKVSDDTLKSDTKKENINSGFDLSPLSSSNVNNYNSEAINGEPHSNIDLSSTNSAIEQSGSDYLSETAKQKLFADINTSSNNMYDEDSVSLQNSDQESNDATENMDQGFFSNFNIPSPNHIVISKQDNTSETTVGESDSNFDMTILSNREMTNQVDISLVTTEVESVSNSNSEPPNNSFKITTEAENISNLNSESLNDSYQLDLRPLDVDSNVTDITSSKKTYNRHNVELSSITEDLLKEEAAAMKDNISIDKTSCESSLIENIDVNITTKCTMENIKEIHRDFRYLSYGSKEMYSQTIQKLIVFQEGNTNICGTLSEVETERVNSLNDFSNETISTAQHEDDDIEDSISPVDATSSIAKLEYEINPNSCENIEDINDTTKIDNNRDTDDICTWPIIVKDTFGNLKKKSNKLDMHNLDMTSCSSPSETHEEQQQAIVNFEITEGEKKEKNQLEKEDKTKDEIPEQLKNKIKRRNETLVQCNKSYLSSYDEAPIQVKNNKRLKCYTELPKQKEKLDIKQTLEDWEKQPSVDDKMVRQCESPPNGSLHPQDDKLSHCSSEVLRHCNEDLGCNSIFSKTNKRTAGFQKQCNFNKISKEYDRPVSGYSDDDDLCPQDDKQSNCSSEVLNEHNEEPGFNNVLLEPNEQSDDCQRQSTIKISKENERPVGGYLSKDELHPQDNKESNCRSEVLSQCNEVPGCNNVRLEANEQTDDCQRQSNVNRISKEYDRPVSGYSSNDKLHPQNDKQSNYSSEIHSRCNEDPGCNDVRLEQNKQSEDSQMQSNVKISKEYDRTVCGYLSNVELHSQDNKESNCKSEVLSHCNEEPECNNILLEENEQTEDCQKQSNVNRRIKGCDKPVSGYSNNNALHPQDDKQSNCSSEVLNQCNLEPECYNVLLEPSERYDSLRQSNVKIFKEYDGSVSGYLRNDELHPQDDKQSNLSSKVFSHCKEPPGYKNVVLEVNEPSEDCRKQFNVNKIPKEYVEPVKGYSSNNELHPQFDKQSNCSSEVLSQSNEDRGCNNVLLELNEPTEDCQKQSKVNKIPKEYFRPVKGYSSNDELHPQGDKQSNCSSEVLSQCNEDPGCNNVLLEQNEPSEDCQKQSKVNKIPKEYFRPVKGYSSNDELHPQGDKQSNCSSEVLSQCNEQPGCNNVLLELNESSEDCQKQSNVNKILNEYDKPVSAYSESLNTVDKHSNSKGIKLETSIIVQSNELTCSKVQSTENDSLEKSRKLKRSLSDSALNLYKNNESSQAEHEERVHFIWPFKRRKMNSVDNDVLAQNLCNIIQSNRRNSISSIYNEENVSFCILIDNSCVISEEENDNQENICYTEISDECLSEVQNVSTKEDEDVEIIPEIMHTQEPFEQEENHCQYSESYVLESEDGKLEESWVEDVACVETIFNDDIAEDIEISGPLSPKDEDIFSDNEESGIFSSTEHTDKVKYIYGDNMCNDDAHFVERLYNTPQMNVNKTLIQRETHISGEYYDNDSLEKILSESNDQQQSPHMPQHSGPDFSLEPINIKQKRDERETTILKSKSSIENIDDAVDVEADIVQIKDRNESLGHFKTSQDSTLQSCESSIDNVFTYKEDDGNSRYITSSSPEVSSTTSEEKNSAILLKITNYKGSRISQINDCIRENKSPRCKFTEEKGYAQSQSNFSRHRPLLTKAAQKYIPPLKESIRDLKVKLSLPQHSLIKLKQLKQSKDEPKVCKQNISVTKISMKPKPKFEDVLKSIDEIQFQMHKEKTKKSKKSIPKVVIKKNENGSHYASTSNKNEYNPDLTGRKWQPWVFIEKNHFIDKMAIKKKTKAVYSHRKQTYVLAEKFQKYKSVNAKFVISPPISDCPSTGLKYTIRLKHNY